MNKKEIAKTFLKLAGMGYVDEAYEKFVASDFIHHNQYFKGDRASLLTAMKEAHDESPNEIVAIKNVFEDGEIVVTHSLIVKKEMKIAVVHIFRIENGKISELWDLGQKIEEDSPNEHGLF